MTRDRPPREKKGLGTSCFQVVSSAIAYSVFLSLCIKLQQEIAVVFPVLGKF